MIKRTGRPPKVKRIKEAKSYRKKGLSFMKIAKIMDSDVKTVFRWVNYDIGKTVDKPLDSIGKRVYDKSKVQV